MSKLIKFLGLLALLSLIGCTQQPALPPTTAPTQVVPTVTPAPTRVDVDSPWKMVLQTKVDQPVRMAAFLNEQFGLTGGANTGGVAHYTLDSGASWEKSPGSSGCLFSLDIVDQDIVWECNYSDLRPSTDGGKTWLDRFRGSGQPGCLVSGVDSQVAWHLTPAVFEATLDGGATRRPVALPEGVTLEKIATVSLRTANDGYLLDPAGNFYVTADGGSTWSRVSSLGLEKYGEMTLAAFNGLAYAAIRFTDAEHGVIILSLAGGIQTKVLGMRTADGGITWQVESVPVEYSRPYLSRDAQYLTTVSPLHLGQITVLHYEPGK